MTWEGVGMTWEGVGMTWEGAGMTWEGVGMAWEGARMTWEGAGMAWEDVGMMWEGVGMTARGFVGSRRVLDSRGGRPTFEQLGGVVVWGCSAGDGPVHFARSGFHLQTLEEGLEGGNLESPPPQAPRALAENSRQDRP